MSEPLFHSYTDTSKEKTGRLRWIIIFVCVVLVAGAGLVWVESLPKPAPYGDLTKRLHPNMSPLEVFDALGAPIRTFYEEGDSVSVYKVHGTELQLLIQFTNHRYATGEEDSIERWCGVIPVSDQAPDTQRTRGQPGDRKTSYVYKTIECHDMLQK